jgi:hypothetical protein
MIIRDVPSGAIAAAPRAKQVRATFTTATKLVGSLGIRMYVVQRSRDDYLILQRASADIVETVDPPKTAHSSESHGRFTIAAAAKP